MKTSKPYLATALVLSGTSSLYICGLVVAESNNEAYALANHKLVPPPQDFASLKGEPLQVAARTLVELPTATFYEVLLSGAVPVLTSDDRPFVRKSLVFEATSGFKANQLAACSSLPSGDDLHVILRSYLRHARIELTENEFLATVALLLKPESAAA